MSAYTDSLWNIVLKYVEKKTNALYQMYRYKEVIDKVEAQLKKTKELSEVELMLQEDHKRMNRNPGSAKGKLATVFQEKEAVHNKETITLCSKLKTAISNVEARLAHAQDEYNYWKQELTSSTRGEEEARQNHKQAVEAERREEERRKAEARRREEEERRRAEEEAAKQ